MRRLLTLCVVPYPIKKLDNNKTKIKKKHRTEEKTIGKKENNRSQNNNNRKERIGKE